MNEDNNGSNIRKEKEVLDVLSKYRKRMPENISWGQSAEQAKKENNEWADLEKIKLKNDESWLRKYGLLLNIFTITFSLLFLIALLIWSWHYLMPENLRWLNVENLGKIQSVLFSGSMGAIISGIIKSQVDKANNLLISKHTSSE